MRYSSSGMCSCFYICNTKKKRSFRPTCDFYFLSRWHYSFLWGNDFIFIFLDCASRSYPFFVSFPPTPNVTSQISRALWSPITEMTWRNLLKIDRRDVDYDMSSMRFHKSLSLLSATIYSKKIFAHHTVISHHMLSWLSIAHGRELSCFRILSLSWKTCFYWRSVDIWRQTAAGRDKFTKAILLLSNPPRRRTITTLTWRHFVWHLRKSIGWTKWHDYGWLLSYVDFVSFSSKFSEVCSSSDEIRFACEINLFA